MGRTKKKQRAAAAGADRHRLYEQSVQCPEAEVDFIDQTFRRLRGRKAHTLREDFCGTAGVCCEWVARRRTNRAIGVDIDREVLDWGREHNLSGLTRAQAARVELLEEDVARVRTAPVDAICAMNFSYWLFKDRRQLKRYLKRVRDALVDDGVLFLDAYGGYDSFREIEEEREVDGFTYVWEQEKYEPISGGLICHIHFAFPDGSRMDRAFSYDWRLWTLPEVRDLLEEAGYSRVTVYWQGWDKDGEPDGDFRPAEEGEADAGWICYITAEK
ncbi:MAG: class I SAM-dependent methyltransferase [Chromatiales bacterium]|jgi:SAM-dependent methyltransferase